MENLEIKRLNSNGKPKFTTVLAPLHPLDVKSINDKELFYLPMILNKNVEMFCKFGEYSLAGNQPLLII